MRHLRNMATPEFYSICLILIQKRKNYKQLILKTNQIRYRLVSIQSVLSIIGTDTAIRSASGSNFVFFDKPDACKSQRDTVCLLRGPNKNHLRPQLYCIQLSCI